MSLTSQQHARKLRHRTLLARVLAIAIASSAFSASGCSSMSGGSGWWSSTGGAMYGATTTAAKGVGGQFKSMGTTVSSAFTKTKDMMMSPFKPAEGTVPGDKEDPTSLANMPGKLSPELWVAQGQLAESQGQYPKALESYNKALQAEPNNLGALVSTARLYDRQGDSKQSVQYFQKALAVNPNDASIHNDLGLAYSKAGNVAAAKDSLLKATTMEPNNVRYRNNLATLQVENGQAAEAIAQLKTVLPPAVAHYNVAYLHFSKQNLAAAQQELQNALQIDPNLQQARDLYARLGGGQAVAQATNAYQVAGNLYQTVQGIASGNVPATQASAQSSAPTTTAGYGTASYATPGIAPSSMPATSPTVSLPTSTPATGVPMPGTRLPDPASLPSSQTPTWLNSPAVMSTGTP